MSLLITTFTTYCTQSLFPGMNDFFDPMKLEDTESLALIQSAEDACQPIMDQLISGDIFSLEEEDILGEEGEFARSSRRCIQTLLGDNQMGNFIRDQYDSIDKVSVTASRCFYL